VSITAETETALALRAVIEGGRIALERTSGIDVSTKESVRDVVTPIDVAIETHMRAILAESGLPIVGEELEVSHAHLLDPQQAIWLLDPIDGTANYIGGLSYYAVSAGLWDRGQFAVGAVCMPETTELFCTFGTGRSLLNGRTVTHEHRSPEASLVAASFTGNAIDRKVRSLEFALFGEVNDATRGCLRLGSAAANICYTAVGRLQAAYGARARIWDIAGATAIAIGSGCVAMVSPTPDDPTRVDYIIGSRETVKLIRDLWVETLPGARWHTAFDEQTLAVA
jgi:myo-inositol-1(or 4)-monophosphatase